MLKSCTKKYTDESDEHTFRFTFYCDGCGKAITAKQLSFTMAETQGDECLRELMWQKEHSAAFGRADSAARDALYQCPSCLEYVCSDCMRGIHTPDGSILSRCKKCRDKRINSYS